MVVTSRRYIIGTISGINQLISYRNLKKVIEDAIVTLWGITGAGKVRVLVNNFIFEFLH